MKIFVCIKQVPDTTDIRWTENNTIVREGVESITNPCDVYAIETAVGLGSATALTMGPAQSEVMLRGAMAAGCEGAVLLSDKKFAGADTLATSKTLAAAIKKLGEFDLIVCGQYAVDGDTAQTGPELANCLGIPQVTYVKEVVSVEPCHITVKRELDEGIETVRAQLPALICVVKGSHEPKRPHINDVIRAQKGQIEVLNADDLGLEEVGLKGSPTYVSKSFRMVTTHTPKMVDSIGELIQKVREYA
jgi:electron transfer flavoprotein beta subunit